MFHYLFTNDLRIKNLDDALNKAGKNFINDTIPLDKSENNNTMTLGFYFNLNKSSNCAKAAADNKIRKVVLNFIKKFQFPNLRTKASFEDTQRDGILLAPMRTVLKILYMIYLEEGKDAFLTRNEIKNFIFYNKLVAKTRNKDLSQLYQDIKKYRETSVFPHYIENDPIKCIWNQEDRQLREMLKILIWAGCVEEFDLDKYKIKHNNLSIREKADIFDIITYDDYWLGNDIDSYRRYMDLSIEELDSNIENEECKVKRDAPLDRLLLSLYNSEKTKKEEILRLYTEFQNRFSPDKLKELTGIETLNEMFLSDKKTNESMCYYLEFHPVYKELFGSIAGGNAYKYGLFYSQDNHCWMSGSSNKPEKLSIEAAINIGNDIKQKLIDGAEIIGNFNSFTNVNDYETLDNLLSEKLGDLYNRIWIQKYYHMVFPDVFSTFYSKDVQKHILYSLGKLPKNNMYVDSGQISLYASDLKIPNAIFAQIAWEIFGDIKHFYRIGTSDKNLNYFSTWRQNQFVGIGWNDVGDLSQYRDKNELFKSMVELYYPSDKRTASRKTNEMFSFFQTNTSQNYVVAMDGYKLFAIGQIDGEYYFDEKQALGHCKPVKWLKLFDESEKLPAKEGKLTTFIEIEDDENLLFLYNTIKDKNLVTNSDENEDNKMKVCCIDIKRKPRENKVNPLNFIIYGAPGTGKTYSTAEYATAIIENREVDLKEKNFEERKQLMEAYKDYTRKGQIVFTTFHQNYSYEDFIQGLRPDTTTNNMSFKTVDGVFKDIADNALMDMENNYVIIIDEINRANISKVFGELITLIEEDKRWGEVNEACATLPSGDIFAVPNNLYIIGTMNSADKSISLIDAALRRRFEFIEQKPNSELIKDKVLKNIFEKLNNKLAHELDSTDLLIGHSYFMNKTPDDLCKILNNSIIPLLYEYFYDNRKKVRSILEDVLKDTNIDVIDEKIGRLYVKES